MNTKVLIVLMLCLSMMGIATADTAYDASVTLENKNTTSWETYEGDGVSATVQYNDSGEEFEYSIAAEGLIGNECYYLIYYADKPDRFDDDKWGGDNPGAFIAQFSSTPCGEILYTEGSTELNMNLPHPNDWNIDPNPDYCNENNGFDDYDNCCGAKLWLIVCNDYDDGVVINWQNAGTWLFETDLIWYDDTGVNEEPYVLYVDPDGSYYTAGNVVEITAIVEDMDGYFDLENMNVEVDLSTFGVDELVTLDFVEMLDCITGEYSGSAMVTTSTMGECIEFDVTATDPSQESYTGEGSMIVEHGECDQLNITPIGYTTLLNLEYAEVNIEPPIWSIFEWWDFQLYFTALLVTCQDEFGNDCYGLECDPIITTTGHASTIHDEFIVPEWLLGLPGTLVIVWNSAEVETCTITAFCEDEPEVTEATIDITFLEPIIQVSVEEETDLYYMDECGCEDCTNVSAQILDRNGDPILMPNVQMEFYVYGHGGAEFMLEESYTNDEGIATSIICLDDDSPGSVEVRAVAEARMGSKVIPIVEPVLGSIELDPDRREWCDIDEYSYFEARCYTDHGGRMQCPTLSWSSTNEYVATIVGNDEPYECIMLADLFAHHSGITNITAYNGSVCSDPTMAIVDGDEADDCGDNVTLVSDDVTFSVNFSGSGCAWLQAVGNPLMWWDECCNVSDMIIVKGANVDVGDCDDPENNTYTLSICYNATTLDVMDIEPGTLTILKCNSTDYPNCTWEDVGGTDNGTCVTVELDHLCLFALAGSATPEPDPDPDPDPYTGGSSNSGTYPANWNTPTNNTSTTNTTTVEPEPEATPEPTPELPTRPGSVTIVTDGNETIVVDEDGNWLPGFTGVFAVLGLLSIAYIVSRRRD